MYTKSGEKWITETVTCFFMPENSSIPLLFAITNTIFQPFYCRLFTQNGAFNNNVIAEFLTVKRRNTAVFDFLGT